MGDIPLSLSAWCGHVEVVELLLGTNADIESKDSKGRKSLSWAPYYVHAGVLKLLLRRDADIEAKDSMRLPMAMWKM